MDDDGNGYHNIVDSQSSSTFNRLQLVIEEDSDHTSSAINNAPNNNGTVADSKLISSSMTFLAISRNQYIVLQRTVALQWPRIADSVQHRLQRRIVRLEPQLHRTDRKCRHKFFEWQADKRHLENEL